jgi:hypothetical protein
VDLEQGSSARACRRRVNICARKNRKAPAVHTGCIRLEGLSQTARAHTERSWNLRVASKNPGLFSSPLEASRGFGRIKAAATRILPSTRDTPAGVTCHLRFCHQTICVPFMHVLFNLLFQLGLKKAAPRRSSHDGRA